MRSQISSARRRDGFGDDLTAACQDLQGSQQEDGAKLFVVMLGGWVRDTRHELEHERFKLGIKKDFFLMRTVRNFSPLRTVRYWSSLPRDLAQSPSGEFFKTRLGKALSNLT